MRVFELVNEKNCFGIIFSGSLKVSRVKRRSRMGQMALKLHCWVGPTDMTSSDLIKLIKLSFLDSRN